MSEKLSQSDQSTITDERRTGAERRRYPRTPMSMKAVFRGGELEGKPCIIRDFCPGGFFLSWPDENIGSQILAIKESLPEKSFAVEFKVKLKKAGEKTYSINFRIMRVFQGGLGVSFIDPDQSVMDVLIKISEATKKNKQFDSEHKKTSNLSGEHTSFFNKSLTGELNLESNLEEVLRTFFKKLDNRLLVLIKETVDDTKRFEYFNAKETFKDNLAAPRDEIMQAVASQLEEKPSLKWEMTLDDTVDGNSLTLVDEKEFETYLVLTGIIADAEAENRMLLFKVAKKLSGIFKTEFDEGLNPIGFSRLFRTIDAYLQHERFGYAAMNIAYQQMEEVLVPSLVMFYEELAMGVEISPEAKRVDQYDRAQSSPTFSDLDEKVEHQTSNSSSGGSHSHLADQTVSTTLFPILDGHTPSSTINVANGLAQTLMTLQNSIAASGSLHEMFQGQADPHSGMSVTDRAVQQQNILQILDKIQQEDKLKWQRGETIGDVTVRLSPMLYGGGQQQIGYDAKNALNLAGGVLNFLEEDQYLSNLARQDLKRMQTVLYKQAVSEGGLFQKQSNPLRNIINLLEQLDSRGGNNRPETRQVVDDAIEKILSLENYDTDSLNKITDNLNQLLDQQISVYERRVQEVVAQCEHEQMMLKELKKPDVQELQESRPQQPVPTGEYKVWQDRARSLARGDSIVVDNGNGDKQHLSLAWTDPDSSRFVFVDGEGNKVANMNQQELIVRLLKGTAEITDENQKPLFDRAIVSSLFSAYDEVKQQIVHDPETGLLNKEKYRTELNLILENAIRDHAEHVFFYLDFSPENNAANEKVSAYLKHLSELAENVFGKQSLIGRLDVKSLGITSEFMSREGALILAETLFKSIEDNIYELNDTSINYPVSVGVSVINHKTKDIDEVISQAVTASKKAKELGENQAFLHAEDLHDGGQESGTEYEAVDWKLWLEQQIQSEVKMPIFGHRVLSNSDTEAKPLFHIFPAFEDDGGIVRSPARFIRACSEDVLIAEFEKQFINDCLHWMAENRKKISASARCLIRVSGKTINSKGALDFVIEKLTEFAVPPGKICFEIPGSPSETERANITRFICTLNEFGCGFSLGQFGADGLGQDAMKSPAKYISLDEILTSDIDERGQAYGLIKSINDIAHMMEKQTIVPQLVGKETMALLSEMGIDYMASIETEEAERLNHVPVEDIE